MLYNPYASPKTGVDDDFEYDATPFYKPTGRIGRLKFLAYNNIWLCAIFVYLIAIVKLIDGVGLPYQMVYVLASPFVFYAIFAPMIRRLTDLGHSRWLACLYVVPYVNAIFFLYLLFAKGKVGVNQYGAPSEPSVLDIVLACMYPIIWAVAFWFGGRKKLFLMLLGS